MDTAGKRVAAALIGMSLLLGACQPPAPVKVPLDPPAPRAVLAATATPPAPVPELVSTPISSGDLVQPEPTAVSFHSSDPLTWSEAVSADPSTLDPARSYETIGGNILSRIYDPLIAYQSNGEGGFVAALAEEVPTHENGGISADGLTYSFKIRPKVHFQDGSLLTASDVAYSFQRGLLQGGTSSPQWLLAEALLGAGVDDIAVLVDPIQPPYDDRSGLSQYPKSQLRAVCETVQSAITADDLGRTVTFRLKQPWGPFLSALPGSWGSITSQAWMKDHGAWDGDCATWQNFYAPSKEESAGGVGSGAMGTGPYRLERWDRGDKLVLAAHLDSWRNDPLQPRTHLQKIVINIIPELSSRLDLMQVGAVDAVELPRGQEALLDGQVGEVCSARSGACVPSDNPAQPLRRWEQVPSSARTDLFFTFDLNVENNPYTGSGQLNGQGIPSNFFNDVHVRRAFALCFNYEKYNQAVFGGMGQRARGVVPFGLVGFDPQAPGYDYDPTRCAEEFKAADLKDADGHSLWDTGFRLAIAYPADHREFQAAAQIWQQELAQINPAFVVSVTGIPWQAYVNAQISRQLPVFYGRWLSDTLDAQNWVSPYVTGCFANRQDLPGEIKAEYLDLINQAAGEDDPDRRVDLYAKFNRIFYMNATALLLYQAPDSVYLPRYVQGWSPNPLLPGTVNWYDISKE